MKKIILGTVLGLVIWGFAAPAAYSKLLDGPQRDEVPPTLVPGGGGYAVVHEDGHVCGVIAGNSYFAPNDKVMGSEYMGCPAGSRIIFQGGQSSDGRVFGTHGSNVIYSNGVFTVGESTIKDGVVTNKDGYSYDTGSGAVIATAEFPSTPVPIWAPTQEPQQPAPTQPVPAETQVVTQPASTETPVVSRPTPETTQFTQAPTSTPVVVAVATAAPTQLPAVAVITVVDTSSILIPPVSVTALRKTQEEQEDEDEWEPKRRRWGGEQQAI